MPQLFVLEAGLGDVIKSMHYCNSLFEGCDDNIILNISFRPEYINPFLEVVAPHLPPCKIVELKELQTFERVSTKTIEKIFPSYNIHRLKYARKLENYQDNEWLQKKRFSYNLVAGEPPSKLPHLPFVIINRDSVSCVTMLPDHFWKSIEKQAISDGFQPVFIGKLPSNNVDAGGLTSFFHYSPEEITLDLRNKTSISNLFWLLKNAEHVYSVANAIAVLAHELQVPIDTYGVMGENSFVYEKRFFDRPYAGFNLHDISNTHMEFANTVRRKHKLGNVNSRIITFLSNNYRDYKHFAYTLDNYSQFIPLTFFFNIENKLMSLPNEISFRLPPPSNNKMNYEIGSLLDLGYIAEYPIKFHGITQSIENIFPLIYSLSLKLSEVLKTGDIILCWNSGEWVSRTIHEVCNLVGAKCLFIESYFFRNTFQISKKPFTITKYGSPEIFDIYKESIATDRADLFLKSFRSLALSKYPVEKKMVGKLPEAPYRFVVGQVPNDSNLVCSRSSFRTGEDLAIALARQNPDYLYVFKPHPEAFLREPEIGAIVIDKIEKMLSIENLVVIQDGDIHPVLERATIIEALSSTVGIEAQLRGKQVIWHGDTINRYFDMDNEENCVRFMEASLRYFTTIQEIGTKVYEIIDTE